MNVTSCRVCRGVTFNEVLNLGMTPFADDFVPVNRLSESEIYHPLRVISCLSCGLVQLSYVAPRNALYNAEYPYVSSTTAMGTRHYRAMADDIVQRFHLPSGSLAIDIGSNVGVLLGGFKDAGLKVLGVEPVPYIAQRANLNGIETMCEFFSAKLASEITAYRGRAVAVTGTNVVAHIDNLMDLCIGLDKLLAPSGVFVFEAPYLGDLLDNLEYDTIYHEHLSYLSVGPVQRLVKQFGLEVFDVEHQAIHGGTLRYFIGRQAQHPVQPIVDALINEEKTRCSVSALSKFTARVRQHRLTLGHMVRDLKLKGHSVAAVSAPAKGMTLLHACGLDASVIDFVTEKAHTKIGRYTPGTRIPVVDDNELVRRRPDYALLLAWNFAREIIANLHEYTAKGGRFIIPIPEPVIVGSETHELSRVSV